MLRGIKGTKPFIRSYSFVLTKFSQISMKRGEGATARCGRGAHLSRDSLSDVYEGVGRGKRKLGFNFEEEGVDFDDKCLDFEEKGVPPRRRYP